MSYLGIDLRVLSSEKDIATDKIKLNFNLSSNSVPYGSEYGIDLNLTGSSVEDITSEVTTRVNTILNRSGFYKLESIDLNKKIINLTSNEGELGVNIKWQEN